MRACLVDSSQIQIRVVIVPPRRIAYGPCLIVDSRAAAAPTQCIGITCSSLLESSRALETLGLEVRGVRPPVWRM